MTRIYQGKYVSIHKDRDLWFGLMLVHVVGRPSTMGLTLGVAHYTVQIFRKYLPKE